MARLIVPHQEFEEHPQTITGLTGQLIHRAQTPRKSSSGDQSLLPSYVLKGEKVVLTDFPAGSVLMLSVRLSPTQKDAVESIVNTLEQNIWSLFSRLDLLDLNTLLYRCEAEEVDATGKNEMEMWLLPALLSSLGHGVYNIPNYGKLSYCGLEGFIRVLREIEKTNDMAHPLFDNLRYEFVTSLEHQIALREGDWAMDYTVLRLKQRKPLKVVKEWLEDIFSQITQLPRYLIPKYFHLVYT